MAKNLAPDATLSERVELLESEFQDFKYNFIQNYNNLIKEFEELRQAIKNEEKLRINSFARLNIMISRPIEMKNFI